jgi:hypothetical protein
VCDALFDSLPPHVNLINLVSTLGITLVVIFLSFYVCETIHNLLKFYKQYMSICILYSYAFYITCLNICVLPTVSQFVLKPFWQLPVIFAVYSVSLLPIIPRSTTYTASVILQSIMQNLVKGATFHVDRNFGWRKWRWKGDTQKYRCRKRLNPFSSCPVCEGCCKLHWLLPNKPSFHSNTRRLVYKRF